MQELSELLLELKEFVQKEHPAINTDFFYFINDLTITVLSTSNQNLINSLIDLITLVINLIENDKYKNEKIFFESVRDYLIMERAILQKRTNELFNPSYLIQNKKYSSGFNDLFLEDTSNNKHFF